MFKSFLLLVFKSIRYRSIRSWLTVLGIIIGIMLVVVILALGSGIRSAVTRTLQLFGSNLIIVLPGKETNPFLGLIGGEKFKEKDLLALRGIRGVGLVMPMDMAILTVDFQGEKKSVMFHSQPWREFRIIAEESKGLQLVAGDWPESDEAREVMLGYRAALQLFKDKIQPGDNLIIKGRRFTVKGFFSEVGFQDEDNLMYLSLKNFKELTSRSGTVNSALIAAEKGASPALIAKQIKFQLSKQEVVRGFSVLTPEKADRLVGNVLSVIELSLLIIAFISLVVGAVGIMNTMYTSVLERTKQIGIMKAIGASNDTVLALFLIESGTIGLVGGFLGIVFGLGIAYVASLVAAQFGVRGLFSFASLDFLGFFAILSVTFITGVVAGILPARQAARMEPAEALRYE